MGQKSELFINDLAAAGRVLLLGGMAVIAHGLSRTTKDVDIWLEPFASADRWASCVLGVMSRHPCARIFDLRAKREISNAEMAFCIRRDGVVRISGLDRPIDIFRVPNNLDEADFETCWQHAVTLLGSIKVMDEIDLLVTKEATSRGQDLADLAFLEDRVRKQLMPRLRNCAQEEAEVILARYADHEVCRAALENPCAGVRSVARRVLIELADAGDPIARTMLASPIPDDM